MVNIMLSRWSIFLCYILVLHIVNGFRSYTVLKTNRRVTFKNSFPMVGTRYRSNVGLAVDIYKTNQRLNIRKDISLSYSNYQGDNGSRLLYAWANIKASMNWMWNTIFAVVSNFFLHKDSNLVPLFQRDHENHTVQAESFVEKSITSPTSFPDDSLHGTTPSSSTSKLQELLELFNSTKTQQSNITKNVAIPLDQLEKQTIGNFANPSSGNVAHSTKSTKSSYSSDSGSTTKHTSYGADTSIKEKMNSETSNSTTVYDTLNYVLDNTDAFVSLDVIRLAANPAHRTSTVPTPAPRGEYRDEVPEKRAPRDDDEDDGEADDDDDDDDEYDDDDEDNDVEALEGEDDSDEDDDDDEEDDEDDEVLRKESLQKAVREVIQIMKEEGLILPSVTITSNDPPSTPIANHPQPAEVSTKSSNPGPVMSLQYFQSLGPSGMIAYILTELSCWSLYPMLVKVFALPPSTSMTAYATLQEREQATAQYTSKLFIVSTLFIMSMLSTEELRVTLATRLIAYIDQIMIPQFTALQSTWSTVKKPFEEWLEKRKQITAVGKNSHAGNETSDQK